MDIEPWALRERSHWRQLHTFGGYLWPGRVQPSIDEDFDEAPIVLRAEKAAEKPMSCGEALDEVEWLLDGGMHPAMALEQVHRSLESMRRAAERRGRTELARRIARAAESDWERRWASNERKTA